MGRRIVVWLSAVVIGCATGQSAIVTPSTAYQLRPVDQGPSDAGFLAFRTGLLEALGRGDIEAVLATMVPEVRRPKEFLWSGMSMTQVLSAPDSVWGALRNLLALGGSFTTTRGVRAGRREFCAPYVYSAFPSRPLPEDLQDEVDPWAILGENVPVYKDRSTRSPIVIRLSNELVKAGGVLGPDPDGSFWVVVELSDGREGYVVPSQIRAPNDYHACFAQIDGRWQMTSFVRGVNPR